MYRELGYAESYMHLLQAMIHGNGQIACAIQLDGPLTPLVFIKALRYLYERQPLMRSRILRAERYYFELSAQFDSIPVKVLSREDGSHWERIIASELSGIVPAEEHVWSATLLYGGEGDCASHEIVMTMNHAAGDGISILRLFEDMLHIISAQSKGGSLDLQGHSLMPPVESLLQDPLSWDEFLANKAAAQVDPGIMTTWRYHRNVPYEQRQTKAIYRKACAQAVKALKSECHMRGATVNSVLNSAMLLAARRMAGKDISSPMFTMVNLRDKAVPKIDDDYLGCCFAVVATPPQKVCEDSDLYSVAEEYQRLLSAALPLQARYPGRFDPSELQKMVADLVVGQADGFNLGLSCSNMGAPAIRTQCGDHRIRGFYIATNQAAGNFPIMLNVVTLSGEMFFSFVYTYPLTSDEWAAGYVDEFMDILGDSGIKLSEQLMG